MTLLTVLTTCLLSLAGVEQKSLTEAQQNALPLYFGFGPFQIYKLKPGISDLRLADLDADGRTDILLWNGHRSRFELFLQPAPGTEPEDGPALERNEIPNRGNLRNQTVPVTYNVAAAEVADLTGDGRADIVFFGEPRELVILPGQADGDFGPASGIRAPDGNPRTGCLAVGDFNSDGRSDVALLGKEMLLLYLQKATGGLSSPQRLVHGIKNPMLMLRTDLNGDGRDDLIVGADDERYGAYGCLQEASGALAAFRPIRIPRVRSLTMAPPADRRGGEDLYAIEYTTNRLKHYRWQTPRDTGVAADWPQRLHSYPVMSKSKQRPLAVGDVNGDGLVDCVTLDPDAAQMVLFKGEGGGLGAGVAFPGLTKATDVHIADIDADGRQEVLTASPEERTLGVSRYEDGRLTFPAPLPARGEPFVVAALGTEPGGAPPRLAYVTRDDGVFFLIVRRDQQDDWSLEIDDIDDDPSGLRLADVNQDGRCDLLLFVRYSSPITLLQKDDGTFEVFTGTDRRAGLLKEATLQGFALADVNGDEHPEVLLAQDNLARALLVQGGRWTVVDQYNPESADSKISGITVLPNPSGGPTLVMYERKADELLVFGRRGDGTYTVEQSMPVGDYDLTAMTTLPIGAAGRPAVLLADPSKLAVITPDEAAATLVEQHSYETETKDALLADAVVGDLNHDGVRDVALIDVGKASIEIVTTTPTGGYVKATRFQVFQGKRFADAPETYGEPREVLAGDVTGDGIDDIVLLVHDRLIVYPGQ